MTQHDVDSGAVAEKVIDGNLHLDIQAVVEPDGNLVQQGGGLVSPDGLISLDWTSSCSDLDPSSVRTIDYLVISDLVQAISGGGWRYQQRPGQLDRAGGPRQLCPALAGRLHRHCSPSRSAPW
ncbi:hypothetical protein [Aeromonas ichthyocola]